MDGGGAHRRVGERALQPLSANPGSDRVVFPLEEAVQVASGDVVRGGYGARGQLRVLQVLLDEGSDV
ncbi:hypothetical protein GCM10015535_69630 [Streptomyces gelaticus]|uniref:Ankyrin repeat domain-containing protein n=1 Tax=Streptomyces gelaticus TaxID=285446 RepID=A0ABQ2WC05_9ACTN|nr:hypothetical protein GCM10015535_69630 [Streptomyces gelaticus]